MDKLNKAQALARAREVLEGLSVGDAIGEALSYQFYRCRELADFSAFRAGSVRYTDDSELAMALFETLERMGGIDEDVLACRSIGDYREALLATIEVGGDCDTNAAIVGGIVTGYAGRDAIPGDWLRAREELGWRG
jgi:ADP-ribosylglycohydrolase